MFFSCQNFKMFFFFILACLHRDSFLLKLCIWTRFERWNIWQYSFSFFLFSSILINWRIWFKCLRKCLGAYSMLFEWFCNLFVLFCFQTSLIYNQRFKEYIYMFTAYAESWSNERNANFKRNWQAANSFRATKSLFISRPSAENQISMKIWRFCFHFFLFLP